MLTTEGNSITQKIERPESAAAAPNCEETDLRASLFWF